MNKFIISADTPLSIIDKNIYGHFSEHLGRCIYQGLYVGEDSPIPNTDGMRNDALEALRGIKIPVLRWPGGCFADEYHWTDGIGPKSSRKKMINTHWGGVVEDNSFGTHEFFRLCELLGCEAYICGNVGSGTVREMQEWVEYITFDGVSPMSALRAENGREKPWRLKYFGVGNENWGCGGNMTPEYYANEYRRYATHVRNFSGNIIEKIACGPNVDDYRWTEVLMREAAWMMDGLSLHYYTPPMFNRSATDFDERTWFYTLRETRRMDELITRHSTIMDKYDPSRRVFLAVDEWGIWCDVEPGTNPGFLYQQNSLRDALIAALNFNIFNRHSARVRMANIAQTANVLQSVILTEGDKTVLTPTWHAFRMYTIHHGASLLPVSFNSPEYRFGDDSTAQADICASVDGKGELNITLVNLDANNPVELSGEIRGRDYGEAEGEVLTSIRINDCNTFENPETVKTVPLEDVKIKDGMLTVRLPSKCVARITLS